MPSKITLDTFMRNVHPEPNTGCWLWDGSLTKKGYGNATTFVGGYKLRMSHRISYYLHNGDFDHKLCVCHTCDTPSCVNPQHLFLGTIEENTEDMVLKGRAAKGENCPKSKLTQEQVIKIRSSYPKEGTTRVLGRIYGVSSHAISALVNRQTWRHI